MQTLAIIVSIAGAGLAGFFAGWLAHALSGDNY